MTREDEDDTVPEAVRSGDHTAFTAWSERYRRQLHVHCYRMLGSFDDAEDLVQETMLRAWRGREGFQGRSLFRTWLYRIATHACLDALERSPRRVLPQDVVPPVTAGTPSSEARPTPPTASEIPWLQPYPDRSLAPDAVAETRETLGLAFLAALQHLPARQRAILILTDVLGWSAAEVAEMLGLTIASVTSALQRARATMRSRRPSRESLVATGEERAVIDRFVAAWERSDVEALTGLLREDARWSMPPAPLWFDGRAAITRMLGLYPPGWQGAFRMVPTAANRQPAAAAYLRKHGEAAYHLTGVLVFRVQSGRIAEITTFAGALCSTFGLPPTRSPMSFSSAPV